MDLVVWVAAAAAFVAAYMIWFRRMSAGLRGPSVWPIVGSLPGLLLNADRFHEWIADNLRATGGTYQTCICAVPLLSRRLQGLVTVTCDPRNMEHVLRTRFDNYPKGPACHAVFHDLLGDGIFNSDGNAWIQQRKTASPEFSSRSLRLAMSRWVSRSIHHRLFAILDAAAAAEGSPVELQDLLLRVTFDNICGITFGRDPETLAPGLPGNTFAAAFDRATEATLQRFILPEALWKFQKWLGLGMEADLSRSVSHLDLYLRDIITVCKLELSSGDVGEDLISRFMRKGDCPDEFLKYVALNFIIAGRDTSSVALSWFFWLVSTHPAAERTILNELCSVLADTRGAYGRTSWLDSPLTFEELNRLVYLKAALSETLRLYPSVPEDTKSVMADDVLPDGTFVPAGSSVTYSIYSVGRMESLWGEDCMEFRPERWLSSDGRSLKPPADAFKFVAFNAGPRICLGKDLAYLQMKSIAAATLLRYSFALVSGHRVQQKMSLTLFMKHGLLVHVTPRDLSGIV